MLMFCGIVGEGSQKSVLSERNNFQLKFGVSSSYVDIAERGRQQ